MVNDTALARSQRDKRAGTVVSKSGSKTVRVRFYFVVKSAKYGKYMNRSTSLHVHDEAEQAKPGDKVEVVSCRRLSKMKCWRLTKIIDSFG